MNLLQTLEYFMDDTAAYMEELSWEIREETNYTDNNIESLSEQYDFNKELHDNLLTIKSELARLQRYDEELSSVMPKDYKDWWQGSKEEWPLIAKSSIES
jgi:cell shape-determining protein MreC